MDYKQLYILNQQDYRLNTSYPLSPSDWESYKTTNQSLDFSLEDELSLYIHIPFCRQLCTFCEYTRMICPNEEGQMRYLHTLEKDIIQFINTHSFTLRGFDIGGGTPTCLSDMAFQYLMDMYTHVCNHLDKTHDFEPSIESTFQTCTAQKLTAIVQAGIRRLSLGLQSTDSSMLHSCHRASSSLESMLQTMQMAHEIGIHKINLDLMYGLPNQTLDSILLDLQSIGTLQPEQVTLYELRTNQLTNTPSQNAQTLYDSYCLLYDALIKMGYHAHFGQNTFSLDKDDFGVSSYLRSRMLYGKAYKGFGISAQSMCKQGVSYNIGKNAANLSSFIDCPTYENGDTYILPAHEIANKYIAISGYSNSFSLEVLHLLLNKEEWLSLQERVAFLMDENLLYRDNNWLRITREGFRNYGTVNSILRINNKTVDNVIELRVE